MSLTRIYERRALARPKANALEFLQSINPESILQIAMMCDAAAEEMELFLASIRLFSTRVQYGNLTNSFLHTYDFLHSNNRPVIFIELNPVSVTQLATSQDQIL